MLTRTEAMQTVRDAASRFIRTCDSATDDDWVSRPPTHAWSIGDIAEHVTIANANILRRLQSLDQHPLEGRPVAVDDAEMPYIFLSGRLTAKRGHANRRNTQRSHGVPRVPGQHRRGPALFIANTLDLRTVGPAHPVFGLLDGVQWLLFCGAHIERHRAQINGEPQSAAGDVR